MTLSGVKPVQKQKPAYESFYPNVELRFLPPYSPELNPIERFWQDVKEESAFHRDKTLSSLKKRMRKKQASYVDEAVASLTGYEYLLEAESA